MLTPVFISASLLSYLLGSISSAILLSNIVGFPDPRTQGSLNPGATNVLRIAGKKAAAATLVFDILKGAIPILVARLFISDLLLQSLIALSAFLGHCYPVFYQFKGGKGVATAIGAVSAFNPFIGIIVIAIWLLMAKGFKISSLAALIAFLCLPFVSYWQNQQLNVAMVFSCISIILFWRHSSNIKRLIQGNEL